VGKWWLIADLSYPRGSSVYAGISEELALYVHIDDVIRSITSLGMGIKLRVLTDRSQYTLVTITDSGSLSKGEHT